MSAVLEQVVDLDEVAEFLAIRPSAGEILAFDRPRKWRIASRN